MSFIRENSYIIFKLIINQIGLTVFGWMLTLSTMNDESKLLLLGGSILSIIFYCFLLYSMVYEVGAKDKIRIDHGRLKPQPAYGLCVSLIANIPNMLLTSVLAISYALARFGNEAAKAVYAVSDTLIRFFMGMYVGLFTYLKTPLPDGAALPNDLFYIYFWFLAIIPSLLVCFLAYYFGQKGIRLISSPPRSDENRE